MKKQHPRPVSFIVFAVVICISVVLDRITKSLAEQHLGGGVTQPFIPGVLDFQLVYNRGAAWGLFEGGRGIFLIVASFTLLAMFIYILVNTRHYALEILGLGLIAGGAIGNGIDRAISGEVVDFIHTLFIDFPLFNIADSSITIGVILFLFVLIFGQKDTGKPEKVSDGNEADDSAPVTGEEENIVDERDAGIPDENNCEISYDSEDSVPAENGAPAEDHDDTQNSAPAENGDDAGL